MLQPLAVPHVGLAPRHVLQLPGVGPHTQCSRLPKSIPATCGRITCRACRGPVFLFFLMLVLLALLLGKTPARVGNALEC